MAEFYLIDLYNFVHQRHNSDFGYKKPAIKRVSCTSLDFFVRESGGERGT